MGDWHDSLYYVNITIGTPGQLFTFPLSLEYGITEVIDISCTGCADPNKFNSSKSSTYKPTNYSYFGAGIFGQDVIRFGNLGTDQLVIPNAMFAQYSGSTRSTIIGMGTIGLGTITDMPNVDSPIITAIKSGILDNPVVTLHLKHVGRYNQSDNGGSITYGALDTVNCDPSVAYEPIRDPHYFQFYLKKVSLGSTEFSGNWNTFLALNSIGIAAPNYIVDALAKEINATRPGGNYVDCNVTFSFSLVIESTTYTMTEKELVEHNDYGSCSLNIYGSGSEVWTLGSPWLTTVCTVLDYGKNRVGFAKIISS